MFDLAIKLSEERNLPISEGERHGHSWLCRIGPESRSHVFIRAALKRNGHRVPQSPPNRIPPLPTTLHFSIPVYSIGLGRRHHPTVRINCSDQPTAHTVSAEKSLK